MLSSHPSCQGSAGIWPSLKRKEEKEEVYEGSQKKRGDDSEWPPLWSWIPAWGPGSGLPRLFHTYTSSFSPGRGEIPVRNPQGTDVCWAAGQEEPQSQAGPSNAWGGTSEGAWYVDGEPEGTGRKDLPETCASGQGGIRKEDDAKGPHLLSNEHVPCMYSCPLLAPSKWWLVGTARIWTPVFLILGLP